MKKICSAFLITAVMLAGSAAAQHPRYLRMYVKNETVAPAVNNEPADTVVNNNTADAGNYTASTSAINKKAIRNFEAEFSKPADVRWFRIEEGFIAYCTIDGIRNRTHYDKRGNWMFTMKYYDEKKLPKDVRARVKRTYYDYNISGVQEIHAQDKTIYLVHLKDEKSFKIIRICDDDMDEYQSYDLAF